MSEIETPPITGSDDEGREMECFNEDHSLADIVRWLMRNPSEAEEVYRLLGEKLGKPERAWTKQKKMKHDTQKSNGGIL